MPSSSFVINPSPSDASSNDSGQAGEGLESQQSDLSPLVYPENLLEAKTYLQEDKVVPFMGFYVMVPKSAQVVQESSPDVLSDASTNDITKLRGLDYASEVNKELNIKNGKEWIENSKTSKDRIRIYKQANVLRKFICLYMPETLNSDLTASYNSLSVGADNLALAGVAIEAYNSGFSKGTSIDILKKLGASLAAAIPATDTISSVIKTGGKFVQAGQGIAVNPLTEVLFENMQFRQFNFDFKFVPKNKGEAATVQEIIKTFRMYMVPEIKKSSVAGIFFSVPAFFQIKYYVQKEGAVQENDKIPKISGCALVGMNVDMAPDGQALHKDLSPVATRIQLNFMELEIMHRDRIIQGY